MSGLDWGGAVADIKVLMLFYCIYVRCEHTRGGGRYQGANVVLFIYLFCYFLLSACRSQARVFFFA
jgi:hypothetical protein